MGLLGNLLDPTFLEDPYATYRRVLNTGPVVWDDEHRMWLVSGHPEVLEAVKRPETSVAAAAARIRPALGERAEHFEPLIGAVSKFLTRVDPPDHTRLRALVQKAFTLGAVERMHKDIESLVDGYLSPLPRTGQMEVMSTLAVPLPITVITRMLGVPAEDQSRIKKWSDDLGSVADNDPRPEVLERAQESLGQMRQYILDVIARLTRESGDDLLSALIKVEESGDRLSHDELFGTVQVLLIAGQETTTNLLGNGLHALLTHPDQMRRLRDEPDRWAGAIEECLRYDCPVQSRTRVVTTDMELGGQRIPAGQTLFLLLGAANRDPRAFVDPDRFDIARLHNHHVAFGHGIHYCLGNALARLEARIALGALITRMPRLALSPGTPPTRQPNFSLRGFTSLSVTF